MRTTLFLMITLGLAACGDSGSPAPVEDNCSSDDLLILGSLASTLFDTTTDCAFGCAGGEGTLGECTSMCVVEETGLSSTCSDCFGIIIECVFENCVQMCINPDSEECTTCIASAGCNDDFEECSGVSPTLDGACADDLGTLVANADTIVQTTTDCGTGCIGDEDISGCTATCVSNAVEISAECSACFGNLSSCTILMCAAECEEGIETEDCAMCRADKCDDGFTECAGFPPTLGGS